MTVIEAGFGEDQTHAQRMLARTEFRVARRRRLILLLPATGVVLWALADLLAARHARGDTGFFADLFPFVWTVAAVMLPLSAGIKPHPFRAATIAAFCSGAILTSAIFGAGGWHVWQIITFALICTGALVPRLMP